jgi:hypothetical protein
MTAEVEGPLEMGRTTFLLFVVGEEEVRQQQESVVGVMRIPSRSHKRAGGGD